LTLVQNLFETSARRLDLSPFQVKGQTKKLVLKLYTLPAVPHVFSEEEKAITESQA
jgi:hypothetical protein